jgi:hypothetical protein
MAMVMVSVGVVQPRDVYAVYVFHDGRLAGRYATLNVTARAARAPCTLRMRVDGEVRAGESLAATEQMINSRSRSPPQTIRIWGLRALIKAVVTAAACDREDKL